MHVGRRNYVSTNSKEPVFGQPTVTVKKEHKIRRKPLPGQKKRWRISCPDCGCTRIECQAYCIWDEETQHWEYSEMVDGTDFYCPDCGDDKYEVDEVVIG